MSIITDILVLRFYGYIRYIGEISMNILTQNIDEPKLIKTHENIKKMLLEVKLEI